MSRKPYFDGMSNEQYWEQRDKDKDKSLKKKEVKIIKEIQDVYKKAFKEIKAELYDFYDKYAKDNNISMAEAQRELSPAGIKQMQSKLQELKSLYKTTGDEKYLMEYQKLSARAKVTRLTSLLDSINVELSKVSGTVQATIEDYLLGIYTNEYRDILELFGVEDKFFINDAAVREIINYPYAGRQFSDRIWTNKDKLINFIEQDLSTALIRGLSIQKMSKQLMERLGVLYYESERLVRTETNFIQNQAHLKGYETAGQSRYRISAHLDSRTSDICRDQNGKVYNIKDATVGVNMPPFHCYCRSRIIPVVEDIKEKYGIR